MTKELPLFIASARPTIRASDSFRVFLPALHRSQARILKLCLNLKGTSCPRNRPGMPSSILSSIQGLQQITYNVSLFRYRRCRQSGGEACIEESGRECSRWKDEDDVRLFIYTPVFTVSLAKKKNRPKPLAIHPVAIRAVFSFCQIVIIPAPEHQRCPRLLRHPWFCCLK